MKNQFGFNKILIIFRKKAIIKNINNDFVESTDIFIENTHIFVHIYILFLFHTLL